MDIKLLLTDLDGTLLHSDHYTVSDRTRAALRALKARGVKLCACTGRPSCVLPPAVAEEDFDFAISCNGAGCVDRHTGDMLFHAYLTADEARLAWSYVSQVDSLVGWFTSDGIVMDRRNFSQWETRLRPKWHREYYAAGHVRVYEDIEEYFSTGVPRLEKLNMYDVSTDTGEKVTNPLSSLSAFAVTTSLGHNLEITSARADKGQALMSICRYLNIDASQVIAFGDGGNDVNMLRCAGVGVAMGNATAAVLAAAPYRTLTNDEDGLADYLEKYIL